MTNTPRNNPEKRANWCRWYCDRWENWVKRICNINCRKLTWWDKAGKEFRYTPDEIKKIKYIISRYKKYITPENINNYLFINEINREIENILNTPARTHLDIIKEELY